MSKARGSPRKFSEKIALLNKKEAEATAEFEKILKEVNETTARTPTQALHPEQHLHHHFDHHNQQPKQYYGLPQRSSSFSHWQRCPPLQHPQQHLHQNHGQYLTQPVQYNQSNQMQQSPQSATQAPMFVNQQVHQHQVSSYANPPVHHQNNHRSQQQPLQQQQQQQIQRVPLVQHVTSNSLDVHNDSVPPVSLGVPNIEIFRIDDDQNYQQVTSAPLGVTDSLTDGHYRYDCSNSSISSARSLPNIANLSVSQTTKCFLPQTSTDQRLMPAVNTTTSITSATDGNQSSPEPILANSHQSDSYMTSEYQYNEEYCSLPAIHEPVATTINGTVGDTSRQSQASMSRNNSWQSMLTNSAPCSAAPTPPSDLIHTTNGLNNSPQHQQQHSPGSTSRQQSPQQLLHQDYYPTQQFQPQGQIQRSSSSIFINKHPANDLLEAPRLDNNLSKSSDACYGYLDNYGEGRGMDCASQIQTGNGDNYGPASLNIVNHTPNPLMRSRSGNDLDNIQTLGPPPRKLSNCATTNQQHFVDTTQYQFYG